MAGTASPLGGKVYGLFCTNGGVKGKLGLVELFIKFDFLHGDDRERLFGEGGRSFIDFWSGILFDF